MSMVNSGDDDLITNQNHIITAIQDQENQLRRNKDNILCLTNHAKQIESHLFIMNEVQEALITTLSIKNQAIEIVNHLNEIEVKLISSKRNKTSIIFFCLMKL